MLRTSNDKWVLYPRPEVVRRKILICLAAMSVPAAVLGIVGAVAADLDTLMGAAWVLPVCWVCGAPALSMVVVMRMKLKGGRVSLTGPLGITWWGCEGSDLDVVVAQTGYKYRGRIYVALNRASERLLGAFAYDTFDTAELDRLLSASGCRRPDGVFRYRQAMIIPIQLP